MTSAWSLPLLVAAVLLAIACGAHKADATYGVDVSSSVTPAGWTCLRNNGFSFGIVRAYESIGQPDSRAASTVANAWAGGMSHVDVYMFPCPHCGKSASNQVDELVNYLRSHGVRYGMVWFDIEGPQYWRDQGFNRAFLSEAINRALGYGINIGIYTSASQWNPIMGNWAGGARFPLWYAHYDGSASFGDFGSFGGWSRPAIKQYMGDASECGVGIDKNWYP